MQQLYKQYRKFNGNSIEFSLSTQTQRVIKLSQAKLLHNCFSTIICSIYIPNWYRSFQLLQFKIVLSCYSLIHEYSHYTTIQECFNCYSLMGINLFTPIFNYTSLSILKVYLTSLCLPPLLLHFPELLPIHYLATYFPQWGMLPFSLLSLDIHTTSVRKLNSNLE